LGAQPSCGKQISTAKYAKHAKGKFRFGIVRVFRVVRGLIGDAPRLPKGRHIGKMALLTELEILGAGFLQKWRAYGAAKANPDFAKPNRKLS
jgi:hypothetical protein